MRELLCGQPGAASRASTAATVAPLDAVLFLCPRYNLRYPSETMWQRLRALAGLGPVVVLPALPPEAGAIRPPEGVQVLAPAGQMAGWQAVPRYGRLLETLLPRLLRTGDGDRIVVWAHREPFVLRAAVKLGQKFRWPVVADIWDVPGLSMYTQWREGRRCKALVHWLWLRGYRRVLERVDLIVCSVASEALRKYLPGAVDVLWIPNGVDWARVGRYREHPGACHPLDGKTWRLLYLGHVRHSRGCELLLELVEAFGERVPLVLELVGPASPQVQAWLSSRGGRLAGRIRLRGSLPWEEALRRVGRADVCLYPFDDLPELRYIYPLKLLEYATAGKWILASDLPGARQLLAGYRRVRFCSPRAVDQWVSALHEVMREAATGSVETGRDFAEWDWERLNRRLQLEVEDRVSKRWYKQSAWRPGQ